MSTNIVVRRLPPQEGGGFTLTKAQFSVTIRSMSTNQTEQKQLREFSLKFADIMIGIVLGLGFQWWPELHQPWQYVAFIFVYLNLIDYWIDYSPVLKRYPFKREVDVVLHFIIIFMMFYLVYATQRTVGILLLAFAIYRIVDLLWLWRLHKSYTATPSDEMFLKNWQRYEIIEAFAALLLAGASAVSSASSLTILSVFIVIRLTTRIMASYSYRSVYFK